MIPRRRAPLQRGLERALHGVRPQRSGSVERRDGASHEHEWELDEWELVVSAVELALLGTRLDTPPAHLALRLARLAGAGRPGHGDRHAP